MWRGGCGLVALETISGEIGRDLGVAIDVIGFDSGEGMPPPLDYCDLPHIWNEGFFKMDQAMLRSQLRSAKLIIGDVSTTLPDWLNNNLPAPVGFVAFDMDYYSSTKAALTLFDGPETTHLPRVHCYFDDLASTNLGCMNTYVGEHLAINEFNEAHRDRKVCRIEQLRLARTRWEDWQERMHAFHNFSHPRYTELVVQGKQHSERPL